MVVTSHFAETWSNEYKSCGFVIRAGIYIYIYNQLKKILILSLIHYNISKYYTYLFIMYLLSIMCIRCVLYLHGIQMIIYLLFAFQWSTYWLHERCTCIICVWVRHFNYCCTAKRHRLVNEYYVDLFLSEFIRTTESDLWLMSSE